MTRTQAVFALSGAIASGKTTAAKHLVNACNASIVSFGQLVRDQARSRDTGQERGELQRLGNELFEQLGPEGLCAAALESAGLTLRDLPVVWDGIRHTEVLHALQGMYAPAPLFLIFLSPPEKARRERMLHAAGSDRIAATWEEHPTETQLPELELRASCVVRAPTPKQAAAQVTQFLDEIDDSP